MNETPAVPDWHAARGVKWKTYLAGTEATLRPVDEPLLAALRLDAPARIAEIGSGGGGTTLEIRRRAPAGSVVQGFDISPDLVASARERARAEQVEVTFEVADMAAAAPAEPYDRLVSRFGIMFFADPPAAFTNLARWLRPGGRFAFAVWAEPARNPWLRTVREVVEQLATVPAVDPDAPGPFRYADAGKLRDLLTAAGFGDLEQREWRGPLPLGGGLPPAEAARFALASFSNFAELLAGAGPGKFEDAERRLAERLSHHVHEGAVRLEACIHIVTGGRP